MQLASGARLAHYEIVSSIGKGGMGEVYRAKDTKLGRDVAIKLLPEEFTKDPERLARFEREARVLASLNHPHIASVYGLEEAGGNKFLVLELAEGEDLSDRLKRGPIPVDDAIPIAAQIADALEAAHEKGIIHRDLKPANIKLSEDGKVKLLDFGLAKALDVEEGDPELSNSPTMVRAATHAGVILGTAAYMSPEQARGKKVDKRADIWAFGVVVHEMLSGSRLFTGETISDTLAAVLTRDVDLESLPAALPVTTRAMIGHCLERDPRKRLRDIGDARLELDETLAGRTASGHVRAVPEARAATRGATARRAFAALILGIVLGAIPVAWFMSRDKASGPTAGVVNLDLNFPADVKFEYFLVTPDGTKIVAQGRPRVAAGAAELPARVYVRPISGGAMTPVPGTEGAQGFQLSNDSRWILFIAPPAPGAPQVNLLRVPIDGSAPPFTLCAMDPKWDSFTVLNSGDYLTLSEGVNLVKIPKDGGTPSVLLKIDTSNVRGNLLIWSRTPPGDRGLLVQSVSYGARGWFHQIGALDLTTGKIRWLVEDAGNPVYVPSGHLVFSRGDALLAAPFDLESMTMKGSPAPIADGLRTRFSFEPATFDLSDSGVLVYSRGGRSAEARRLGTIDPSGNLAPLTDERRVYQFIDAGAADGKRFVVTITNGQGIDELWLGELQRPGLRRVFAIPDADILFPVISRDGLRVAFVRRGRNDDDGVYIKELDAASPPARVAKVPPDENRLRLSGWTPDGSTVLAVRRGADRKSDVVRIVVPQKSGELATIEPIVASHAGENSVALSPDGRLLAWASDETGRSEIYVAPYGENGRVGNGIQLTTTGGRDMVWAADGRSLRYLDAINRGVTLPVSPAPPYAAGAPVTVFDATELKVFPANMLPDGRQITVVRGENEEDEVRGCAVVLNWTQQLTAAAKRTK
ncbi:MAG: serine/threonine-protein kinase [Thermoanaerobaculia bacterium]|nr:serine/threonine-protein kinase [Thermoanaerobaculia bacterium]